jgi:cbb3-type cytochrome oxidase subunit 1
MEWFVKAYLKASLTWLGAGVTLGIAMAVHPAWTVYRTAHLHMNLLGFVAMMIFGIAYHVIPRFSGNPLHSRTVAVMQWWMSNAGLVLMAAGFVLIARGVAAAWVAVAVGGLTAAAAAYAFIYNLWRTIDGPTGSRRAVQRVNTQITAVPAARRLPVNQGAGPAAR